MGCTAITGSGWQGEEQQHIQVSIGCSDALERTPHPRISIACLGQQQNSVGLSWSNPTSQRSKLDRPSLASDHIITNKSDTHFYSFSAFTSAACHLPSVFQQLLASSQSPRTDILHQARHAYELAETAATGAPKIVESIQTPAMSSDRGQPVPKAGASLSERIAALQRKTSNSARSNNLSPPSTASGTTSGRLSPGESPSRSPSGSSGINAVRDRIAKFQSSDEKPVMPRSSFGSPAPNPEIRNARRQFPGASAGKGTGAWGEGVLRPQMTGGVWLGAGAGGGWGEPGSTSLRPQMTGGAFLGNGAPRSSSFGVSRFQRGASDNIVHGTGRDAFAELDDDLVLTGRNRPEPPAEAEADNPNASKEQLASGAVSNDGAGVLPKLPDTPTAEIDLEKIHATSGLPEAPAVAAIPEFPEAPSAAPKPSTKISSAFEGTDATPDTSIEIGIHGRSADDVERIRQRAHNLQLSEDAEDVPQNEPWIAPPPADLAEQVPKPIDTSEILAARRQSSTDSSQEPWVQGYGRPTVDRDLEAAGLAAGSPSKPPPADYSASGTLPQRAQVDRTDSGRVDPLDPAAHQVRGPGLLVPRDEVAEAKDLGPDAVKASLAQSPPTPAAASPSTPVSKPTHFTRSVSNGHLSPTDASPSTTAADQARQAVAMGRTKSQSQRLRRPPPGTVLSAADLDASDDEYEPGWASVTSVMSSSRS
ncbi:uncharacterized protein UTRI_00630_B [Ustilago trichophora]|uniref:Uncharacterized protein n=1 Tax=Ustilago trichophora TaxID=86804 RepID=A0A5C3DPM0_9BASI|nr:uncharacterized protein UTRI_00630_B [Ustilago trichophora]